MRIIDVHQHLWIGDDGTGWVPSDREGTDLLRGMDENGVEWAVLHAVPTSHAPHCGDNPDVLRAVQAHPDRFIGSVYVNLRDATRSAEALKRYLGEGFRCVKTLPYLDAVYPDDPACEPVWDLIEEAGAPMLVHTGQLTKAKRHQVHPADSMCNHPLHLANVAARHPNVNIIVGHLSRNWFWDAVMLHISHQNLFLEVSTQTPQSPAYQFLAEWEAKGPKDRVRVLRLDNHVMFGSDYGAGTLAERIGWWRAFVEEVGKPQYLDTFFYATAARLFGIEAD